MIGLVDDDELEALAGSGVDLLCLCHLLEQLLHHHAIVVAHIGRRDLEVIDRSDDVELELAVGRGLEDAGVDFDLVGAGAVEFAKKGDDTRFLACSRGSIDEEVREVAAVSLKGGLALPADMD